MTGYANCDSTKDSRPTLNAMKAYTPPTISRRKLKGTLLRSHLNFRGTSPDGENRAVSTGLGAMR
jgi:hypothetical protein